MFLRIVPKFLAAHLVCNASSFILESSGPFCLPALSRSQAASEKFLHCLSLRSVSSQRDGRLWTSLATKQKKGMNEAKNNNMLHTGGNVPIQPGKSLE